MKLPVEGQPRQLTLQLHADVPVLWARQGHLGLAVGLPATSWQPGLNHLTQVGEERFDWRSQTSVQLLGGRRQGLDIKRKQLNDEFEIYECTWALLWMATDSILSSHTHCMSVSRTWYAVSPNQLLARSWQPLMLTGSQGRCRRTSASSIMAQKQDTKQTKQKI